MDVLQDLPLPAGDAQSQLRLLPAAEIGFFHIRKDLLPALSFLQMLHGDLGRADAGQAPPGKQLSRFGGKHPVKELLQLIFYHIFFLRAAEESLFLLPVHTDADPVRFKVHGNLRIVPVGRKILRSFFKNLHRLRRVKGLYQGMDIIFKTQFIQRYRKHRYLRAEALFAFRQSFFPLLPMTKAGKPRLTDNRDCTFSHPRWWWYLRVPDTPSHRREGSAAFP